MKITVRDEAYGDRRITVYDGAYDGEPQRRQHRRDDRFVGVALEPGELHDLVSTGDTYRGMLLRPRTIHIHWHRGDQQYEGGAWRNPYTSTLGREIPAQRNEQWTLVRVYAEGLNIKKNGEPGQIPLIAGFVHSNDRPELIARLLAEHDPAAHGWPLDRLEI